MTRAPFASNSSDSEGVFKRGQYAILLYRSLERLQPIFLAC